jgi:hypothetical protein
VRKLVAAGLLSLAVIGLSGSTANGFYPCYEVHKPCWNIPIPRFPICCPNINLYCVDCCKMPHVTAPNPWYTYYPPGTAPIPPPRQNQPPQRQQGPLQGYAPYGYDLNQYYAQQPAYPYYGYPTYPQAQAYPQYPQYPQGYDIQQTAAQSVPAYWYGR